MTVVIRCTSCRGLSRVDVTSLGEVVLCPHCQQSFPASPDRPDQLRRPDANVSTLEGDHGEPSNAFSHQPIAFSPSVLYGLALLPFIMPLLWIAAQILSGWETNVTLAIPISLAVTAATLSIAVVSTVDWTPSTRVKGVLMIVGLAYFAGIMLFFLKKDAVEWIKQNLTDIAAWKSFTAPRGNCKVLAPGHMFPADRPIRDWKMNCYRVTTGMLDEERSFILGFEFPWAKGQPNALTLDGAKQKLLKAMGQGIAPEDERECTYHPRPEQKGLEWTISLADGSRRVTRLYRLDGRLYYLAVEGGNLTSETAEVATFFDSFILLDDEK